MKEAPRYGGRALLKICTRGPDIWTLSVEYLPVPPFRAFGTKRAGALSIYRRAIWNGGIYYVERAGRCCRDVCVLLRPKFSCEGIPSARQAGGLAVTIEPAVATG